MTVKKNRFKKSQGLIRDVFYNILKNKIENSKESYSDSDEALLFKSFLDSKCAPKDSAVKNSLKEIKILKKNLRDNQARSNVLTIKLKSIINNIEVSETNQFCISEVKSHMLSFQKESDKVNLNFKSIEKNLQEMFSNLKLLEGTHYFLKNDFFSESTRPLKKMIRRYSQSIDYLSESVKQLENVCKT